MINKELANIGMADLEDLRLNAVRESRTIEYKVQLNRSKRDERKELLADITALANTAGGDLLFGVAEKQGEPTAFPGIPIDGWDALERDISSLIRDGTQPRLQGVRFHRVPTAGDRYVLIMRIPRSYNRPHRVILGGHGHFYARDSSQKYTLDVEDLRRAFTLAAAASEMIDKFRYDRTQRIARAQGIMPTQGTVKAVLHLIPDDALTRESDLDLSGVQLQELHPLPQAALGYSDGIRLEAVYCYNDWSYTAIFRNGNIEAVEGLITQKNVLFPTDLELEIIEGTRTYLGLLQRLQVGLPVRVFLTLLGVAGHSFPLWSVGTLGRGVYRVQEEILELRGPALDSLDVDIPLAFRQLFDRLWNAFGYTRCLDYNEDGAWQPRRRKVLA